MARQIRDGKIDSREARKKLQRRREPYWLKMAKDCHLGYRKLADGRGSWVAKFRSKTGKRLHKSLGAADDAMDADGVTALSFTDAQKKARDWFQSEANGGTEIAARKLTVNGAMDRYLDYIKARRKSHAHLDTYVNAYIRPRLGKVLVTDLTTAMVRGWHEGIASEPPRLRRRKGGLQKYREEDPDPAEARRKRQLRANRHLTTLKAGLSLAWRDGLVAHRDAWERVQLFGNVERQRTRFLTPEEARRLLEVCDPPLRRLVQAALLTGARYGELCALDVRDFMRHAGSVYVRDSKSGKARHIYLNRSGMEFFAGLVKDRKLTDPMLCTGEGSRWARDLHFRPFKAALALAGIESAFTFHELRHTWASLTIMAGAPLIAVAQNLGHRDTRMVELHYGHLSNNYIRQVIQNAAPSFSIDNDGTSEVVEMRRGIAHLSDEKEAV